MSNSEDQSQPELEKRLRESRPTGRAAFMEALQRRAGVRAGGRRSPLVTFVIALVVLALIGTAFAAGNGRVRDALRSASSLNDNTPREIQYNDDFAFCHANAAGFFLLKFGAAARAHERLHEEAHAKFDAGEPFSTHIDDFPATQEDLDFFEETGKRRCISEPPHDLFQPR